MNCATIRSSARRCRVLGRRSTGLFSKKTEDRIQSAGVTGSVYEKRGEGEEYEGEKMLRLFEGAKRGG